MSINVKLSSFPLVAGLVSHFRRVILSVHAIFVLPLGLLIYQITGRTPVRALQAMIWMFCISGGRFNDFISRRISSCHPPLELPDASGLLGDLGPVELAELADNLRRDGFVVFPSVVPTEVCDRIEAFASRTPATIRPMDGQSPDARREALYDPENPQAVRYDYHPSDLIDVPDVQDLIADHSLVALVQEYLKCTPMADVLNMWWHTSFQDQPDREAAQFFHFDMDRIKWLKVFVYLTDVGPNNGPHAFVRGSHRSGAIPSNILDRGYVRLTDKDVEDNFQAEDIRIFTAPRGSVIIEDTRGLHKGVNVREGARLILQMQFSNSLFGTNLSPALMRKVRSTKMKNMLERAPAIYRQYVSGPRK